MTAVKAGDDRLGLSIDRGYRWRRPCLTVWDRDRHSEVDVVVDCAAVGGSSVAKRTARRRLCFHHEPSTKYRQITSQPGGPLDADDHGASHSDGALASATPAR